MTASFPPPSDLPLLATDVEEDLASTVRGLVSARSTPDRVTALYDGDRSVVGPLWTALSTELGLAGLLVPDELGGAGASAREAASVLFELGRAVSPVPFLTSSVVATSVALAAGEPGLLGELAGGAVTAALVVPLSTGPSGFEATVTDPSGSGCSGRVPVVAGALEADVLLVPVSTPAGVEVRRVEKGAAGVSVTPAVSLDMTRQVADVTFESVAADPLLGPGDGEVAVQAALEVGAALLASEQVGIAEWCLHDTVQYLKQRRQFGRVLAGYQALKHRLADLYIEVESARAAAQYAAAAAAAGDPDLPVAARVAQAYCSGVAVHVAEECVQLHGGIGMTWEHPAHLYLKRAKADQLAFGGPGEHLAGLAGLVGLPPG